MLDLKEVGVDMGSIDQVRAKEFEANISPREPIMCLIRAPKQGNGAV